MMLTDRQLLILDAIMRNYTTCGVPVGSKTLQKQLPLQVSTATIRNEMAALEKQGYLVKQHSSSGRIPSLKGYRYYVDYLVQPSKIDDQALTNIRLSLDSTFSKVDELIATSSAILSDLTNCTAFSLKPTANDLTVAGFRMVPLKNNQVTVILATSDGNVKSQVYTLKPELTGAELEAVINIINDQLLGLTLPQVLYQLHTLIPLLKGYLKQPEGFLKVFGKIIDEALTGQIYVSGKTKLLDLATESNLEQVKSLYSLVDHSDQCNQLFKTSDEDITVTFSGENPNELLDYSLITANYHIGTYGRGTIAILGPTNMPYSKIIGLLGAFREELAKKMITYYE